ncbi:hypothetical protein D3C78_1006370 [compost metagenome]
MHESLYAGNALFSLVAQRGIIFKLAGQIIRITLSTVFLRPGGADIRHHIASRGVATLNVAGVLKNVEQARLCGCAGVLKSGQRAVHVGRIKTGAGQQKLVIAFAERLAGQRCNALIVGPCVFSPLRRNLPRPLITEQATGHQLKPVAVVSGQIMQGWRAGIAPAAKRVKNVLQLFDVHSAPSFNQLC